MSTTPKLRPTVSGKVDGIIGLDPLTVQCHDCGAIAQQTTERTGAVFILLCGYHFHTCEANPPRRCPQCLAAAKAACENGKCRR